MTKLDTAIIEVYTNLAIPADRIVVDPQLAATFCDAVNHRLPHELQVEQTTLIQRLLNLRKRGEMKGGLPRIERGHAGRVGENQRNRFQEPLN